MAEEVSDVSDPSVEDCPAPAIFSAALGYVSATTAHVPLVVSDPPFHGVTCNYVLPDDEDPRTVAVVQLYNLADADRVDMLEVLREGQEGTDAIRRDDLGEEAYLTTAGGCTIQTRTSMTKVSLIDSDDSYAEECQLVEALFLALH